MKKFKLGILGIGNMGGSILSGIITSNIYQKEQIYLFDIDSNKQNKLQNEGFNVAENEKDLIENIEILILAVKPQMLNDLKKYQFCCNNLTIISVVAGKTSEQLEEIFGKQTFVRVMPNTPSLIGFGTTVIGINPNISKETINIVKSIFSSIGSVYEIDEKLINEVIPFNGSMPAFLYRIVKAYINSSINYGFSEELSKRLIADSIIGSCQMILNTDKSIDELISDVCSKKGATLEGVKVLEDALIDEIIKDTCDACIKRAYELKNI